MDLTHWIVLIAVFLLGGLLMAGLVYLTSLFKKDEAIDAAIFLAQREAHRELRERLEQLRQSPGR
jgi:hypothetical protein